MACGLADSTQERNLRRELGLRWEQRGRIWIIPKTIMAARDAVHQVATEHLICGQYKGVAEFPTVATTLDNITLGDSYML